MKISELARRADATAKTVRYYESLGLITPQRLANGYRDYGEEDVRLVREIRALTRLGIPVERTRPFLECLAAGRAHADDCHMLSDPGLRLAGMLRLPTFTAGGRRLFRRLTSSATA
ncbi:MerR family transcriptional regulator [Streptomyces sp. NPDC058294]|uniref:MerR family transcriptional regulator n=1 Tax=Streptomyces sp. NPDC058294 TaxID=3346430 RepID=UPI0036E40800